MHECGRCNETVLYRHGAPRRSEKREKFCPTRVVETPERTTLVAVQTPQGFQASLLRRALATSDADATDEAALVEALGEAVVTVEGDPRNLKITTPLDLALARALLRDPVS